MSRDGVPKRRKNLLCGLLGGTLPSLGNRTGYSRRGEDLNFLQLFYASFTEPLRLASPRSLYSFTSR
jgi:hypothetical protein